MNILRKLRERAKEFDCSVCGTNHSHSDIRVLGKLESAWIVRVTCTQCQTAFKLLVVDEEERVRVSPVREEPERPRRPAVTADEVIDAHDFLESYKGDVRSLIGGRYTLERKTDRT